MGGERSPLPRLRRLCSGKTNIISLSHWDLDHVGFALRAKKILAKACIETPPLGRASPRKRKILTMYPPCAATSASPVKELTHFSSADLQQNTNDLSHVFLVAKNLLIPGDSTAKQEKIWIEGAGADLRRAKFLLLGHHGSRTSTSEELLGRLRHLKTAVASARYAKYGHPHLEVVRRLQKYHVPLLKTEDWGNLWFENP
jgi:competence protein ComEC